MSKSAKLLMAAMATFSMALGTAAVASAATTVPGQTDRDGDVTGHYTSAYTYDGSGDYYWDLGDGRIQSSPGIDSVDDLDQSTLTVCDYVVNYRGDFGDDPFLDSGWIMNQINCSGHDDNGHYSSVIVSEDDPRYRGNPDEAIWGNWEYHVRVESGKGNLARPYHPVE